MKNRLMLIAVAGIGLLAAAIMSLFTKAGLPGPAEFSFSVPSVMLALIAVAAVAAVLAAVYHPPLFSWRSCSGMPHDDSGASFMAGKGGSGGMGKGKGKGGGGKRPKCSPICAVPC